MPDEPSENHDGNTQPLPNITPGAPTEPLRADATSTEPVAYAPAEVIARRPLPRWIPMVVIGLVIVAVALFGAMLLPGLLAQSGVPLPTPTATLPTPTPTKATGGKQTEAPPPAPEPTVSVPVPTVEPTDPLPTPTG